MNLARPLGWIGLVGGLLAQLAAYVIAILVEPGHAVVGWLAVVGIATSLSGTLIIGTVRNNALSRPATLAAWVLLLVPLLAFGGALLLPEESLRDPLILGLPRRAALVLLVVGVLPVFVLPLAYASDSSSGPLDADALQALRTEAERLRSGAHV